MMSSRLLIFGTIRTLASCPKGAGNLLQRTQIRDRLVPGGLMRNQQQPDPRMSLQQPMQNFDLAIQSLLERLRPIANSRLPFRHAQSVDCNRIPVALNPPSRR